ncbi:MAG: HD domain-containing protein [Patescibacteria group bacterium]|nr:HD domain-containing protein [Patescibacteria group bacterium]
MKVEERHNLVVTLLQLGGAAARNGIENLIAVMPSMLPEVAALRGVTQGADYHPEGDAFEHTMRVITHLQPMADLRLVLAALLHDIGKAHTRQERADGRIVFPGHARVGAAMSQLVLARFGLQGYAGDVYSLIDQHMKFFDAPKMRASRLARFVAQPLFPLLLELHRVDKMGGSGNLEYFEFCRNASASH